MRSPREKGIENTEGLSIPKLTGILTRHIPKSLFHIAFDAPLFPAKEFVMHSLANAHKNSMEDLVTVFLNPEAMRHMFQSGTAFNPPVLRKKWGRIVARKMAWIECWHVKGKYRIGKHSREYDFTLYKRKENGTMQVVPYNLKIE